MYLWMFLLILCGISSVSGVYKDVVFMLDKSDSLTSAEFDKSLLFVHDVIQSLNIGVSETLASLMTISTPPAEIFGLNAYSNRSDYLQAVNNQLGSTPTGEGNIKRGLNFVWENSFKTSPPSRINPEPERVVILLTSTVTSDSKTDTVAVADKIRTDFNASIFTLGVGPNVYTQNTELRGVANDPDANFTHFVDTFDDLWCAVPIIVAKLDPSTSVSPYTNCTLKPLPPFPSSTSQTLFTTFLATSTSTIEVTPLSPETTSSTAAPVTTTEPETTTSTAIARTTSAQSTTTGQATSTVPTTAATIATTATVAASVPTYTTSQVGTTTTKATSLSTSASRTSVDTTEHATTTTVVLGPAESAAATSESSSGGSGSVITASAVVTILAAAVAGAILLILIIRKRRTSPSREDGSILAIVRQYRPAPIGPSKATFSYHRF